jgi:hypothetical protein
MEMGNDEFILYVRKHHPQCHLATHNLGRQIWEKIRVLDPGAREVRQGAPCYWGHTGNFVAQDKLPKTSTQFEFDGDILPELYVFLDALGTQTLGCRYGTEAVSQRFERGLICRGSTRSRHSSEA